MMKTVSLITSLLVIILSSNGEVISMDEFINKVILETLVNKYGVPFSREKVACQLKMSYLVQALANILQICFMEGTCPQWSTWTDHGCACIEKEGVNKPLRKRTRTCEPSYHKTECLGTPLMYTKCDGMKCCPVGWKMINLKCYFSDGNEKLNFSDSVDKCKSMGAKLAEPMTLEENMNIYDNFEHRPFWIGISDLIKENS